MVKPFARPLRGEALTQLGFDIEIEEDSIKELEEYLAPQNREYQSPEYMALFRKQLAQTKKDLKKSLLRMARHDAAEARVEQRRHAADTKRRRNRPWAI